MVHSFVKTNRMVGIIGEMKEKEDLPEDMEIEENLLIEIEEEDHRVMVMIGDEDHRVMVVIEGLLVDMETEDDLQVMAEVI